ncbi:hypothetical protein C8R45DRAFT_164030 [Mycena sanguinolenta]|nr:hypothetical protein C8R45DRAFT_164030 [Mycena sanguinolenta]
MTCNCPRSWALFVLILHHAISYLYGLNQISCRAQRHGGEAQCPGMADSFRRGEGACRHTRNLGGNVKSIDMAISSASLLRCQIKTKCTPVNLVMTPRRTGLSRYFEAVCRKVCRATAPC